MKKLSMLISMVVLGVLFAGGVALAANVQCEVPEDENPAPCLGTPQNDRILGTEGDDQIRARQGDDFVSGFDGSDSILGGTGADKLNGNTGTDFIVPFAYNQNAEGEEELRTVDNSDDIVRGGAQFDLLYGGFGQGGRDQVFGDGGNDIIFVSQRQFRAEGAQTKITRETVNCGPGEQDQVVFDDGIDTIDESCEILNPIAPNGEPVNPPVNRSAQEEVPSGVERLINAS